MRWFNGWQNRAGLRNGRRRRLVCEPLRVLRLDDRTTPAVFSAAVNLPSMAVVNGAAVSVPDLPTQLVGTPLAADLGPFALVADSITAAQLSSSLVSSVNPVSPPPVTPEAILLNPPAPLVRSDPSQGIGGAADLSDPLTFRQDSGYAEPDTGPAMPTIGQTSLASAGPDKPGLFYWRIWSDANGVSHQTRRELNAVEPMGRSRSAAPESVDKSIGSGAQVFVLVRPPGWVSEWHQAEKPQWVVPIFGRWFVETTDGKRVEMGPGDASFDNDQNGALDARGQIGHRSGTVGQLPAVVITVQTE